MAYAMQKSPLEKGARGGCKITQKKYNPLKSPFVKGDLTMNTLNHVYIVHPVKLFIKTKRVVCHRAMKLFGMGNGILPLLKDMDAVIIGFIRNEFTFHKIGHVRVYLITPDFIGDDNVIYQCDVVFEPLSCTIDGTKLFRRLLLKDDINLVNWGNGRTIIGTMRIFQEFLV